MQNHSKISHRQKYCITKPCGKRVKPFHECRVLSPRRATLSAMPVTNSFFTKRFSQTLAAVRLMASSEGTSVNELTQRLSVTRRSVSRLIRSIKTDLHIPVIVKRKGFGGQARYFLPESFIECLSQTSIPRIKLTFDEAVTVYLLSISGLLPKECNCRRFCLPQNTSKSSEKRREEKQ